MINKIFCIAKGGLDSRNSFAYLLAIKATCRRLGIPFLFVLPSLARPVAVCSKSAVFIAGCTFQFTSVLFLELFHMECTFDFGMCNVSPCFNTLILLSMRTVNSPDKIVKSSAWYG